MIKSVRNLRDTAMTEFTPKTSSDAKKTYAHPDVIDLLSVDETKNGKTPNLLEGTLFGGLVGES
jgi:hypothetical protein